MASASEYRPQQRVENKVAAAPRGGRRMPKNAVSGGVHRGFQQAAKNKMMS